VTGSSDSAPPRRPLARRLAAPAASLALAIVLLALWGLWEATRPGPAARQGPDTTVILRHGARLSEIASDLQAQGVIRSATVFMVVARVTGAARGLKAGEYDFLSRTPLRQVMLTIQHGLIVHHHVTIPEGASSSQVMTIMMTAPVLVGSPPAPAEGSILPDTYEVQRGADRAAVLQRMAAARDRLLADLWPRRRADLPLSTPEQAMILASIVEKETALASERPRIAAVFVNRLQKGVRLESDPTIIYGITHGLPLGHGIRESERQGVTPYNTYRINGLPPTPICNPGRASIEAVLDPPHTSELYFVADGTGGHAFASTFEEHNRNVQRWRQIEQSRLAHPAATPASPGLPAKPAPLRGELRSVR